jgi:hypothetical protein
MLLQEEPEMPVPRRNTPRHLGESMRRKLEVASAMAWEALVDTHVEQATHFVALLSGYLPLEEALPRYLREADLGETMATAIRTRVLMRFEEQEGGESHTAPPYPARPAARPAAASEDGWALLRQSQRVVEGVRLRQRRNEEMDRIILLALARAEENLIRTHVENAIGFVALLQEQLSLDRSVQQYLGAVGLAGGRAQAVFQRTMAKLADVHLPL